MQPFSGDMQRTYSRKEADWHEIITEAGNFRKIHHNYNRNVPKGQTICRHLDFKHKGSSETDAFGNKIPLSDKFVEYAKEKFV
jgi:hypothetical protein